MNKIEQVDLFNKFLDKFIEHLEKIAPVVIPDLIVTKTYLRTIRIVNPKLVVENFMHYLIPFKSKIKDCDEEFFLNYDYDKKEASLKKEFSTIMTGFRFKKIWNSDISYEDKGRVFLFMNKLLDLGEKII